MKIKFKSEESQLNISPDLNDLTGTFKSGTLTIVANPHALSGEPVLWVSLSDFMKLKRDLKKKERSGAV